MAEPTSMPDLMDVLVNVGKVIPDMIMAMQAVIVVMGIYMTATALTELWGVSHDNALKYLPGRNRFSIGSALIQLVIGAVLLSMGTLELVGILSRTLTTDYANSRMLSYTAEGASTLKERAQLATLALLGIMQVVGLTSMVKGWLSINNYYNQQAQSSLGTSFTWLIGGVLAWNFKWVSDVINNTLGFNIIGLFTPF